MVLIGVLGVSEVNIMGSFRTCLLGTDCVQALGPGPGMWPCTQAAVSSWRSRAR